MEQSTPKFDQLKKRFLSKVSTLEGSRHVDFAQTSTGIVNDNLFDITKTDVEHKANLSTADTDLSNMELVEDILHVGLSKALGSSPKKTKPKSKHKITTLRQSVNDVRQHESNKCSSEINPPCVIIQPSKLICSKLTSTIRTLHNSVDSSLGSRSIGTSKTLNFEKVDKNLGIAISTQDIHEVIGWFQEKAKLLTKEFSLSSGEESRPTSVRRGASSTATATSSTTSSNINNTPKQWEDLQLYLDYLKTEVRKSNQINKSTTDIPTISAPIVGNKPTSISTGSEHSESLHIINKLHELSLFLVTIKVNEKIEYIKRLHSTIEEQTELTERLEERVMELREKVREYGRENADLEHRIVELQSNLHHAMSVRYESADRIMILQQHCETLETQIQQKNFELNEIRHQQQQQQEEMLLLHRSSARPTDRRQRYEGSTVRDLERVMPSSLLSDSESDRSVEVERRRKITAATAGSRSTGSSTPHTSQHHSNMYSTNTRSSLQSVHQQLQNLNEINWQNVFLYEDMSSTAELQVAEDELSSIEAELENCLHTFKSSQRQLRQHLSVRRRQMTKIEEEKRQNQSKVHTSDMNVLCCICLEGTKSILLLPCRHLCVCEQCSQGPTNHITSTTTGTSRPHPGQIKTCPICRTKVEECLKVFS